MCVCGDGRVYDVYGCVVRWVECVGVCTCVCPCKILCHYE